MYSRRQEINGHIYDEHALEEDIFVTATDAGLKCPVSIYLGNNSHDITIEEARWLGAALIKSANLAEGETK